MRVESSHRVLGIEAGRRRHDLRRAEEQERQEAVEPTDVEQRLTGQPDIVLRRVQLVDPAQRAHDEAAVAEQCAFRATSGARRVHHERNVLLRHLRPGSERLGLGERALIILTHRQPDRERRECEVRQFRADDEADGVRVAKDVRDLVPCEADVHRHGGRACAVAREQRLDELEAVVKKQSDAVARADATCDERAGQTIGACVELREAPRLAAEGERRLVRVQAHAAADELGEDQPPRAIKCLMSLQIIDVLAFVDQHPTS